MNDVKIKIHKLGMIGESEEITLNKLMVFSGESGLGKSYLSIICHYIFAVLLDKKRISSYFDDKGFNFSELRNNYHGTGVAIEFKKTEFQDWLSKDAIVWLGYMIKNKDVVGDIDIILPSKIPSIIKMHYEEEMTGLANDVDVYLKLTLPGLTYRIKDFGGIDEESPFAFLFRYYLIQEIFGDFKDLENSYVFPPSRGTMLTETVEPTTGMYVEFKKNIQYMLTAKPNKIEGSECLTNLLKRVLDGHVSRREGQYIYSTNDTEMPLSAAAASVRELASIEFLIENTDISKIAIMIDEPEAHLHPLKQRMMADIISCLLNGGAHVQITTHSDYFLRRLNELVMMYLLFEKSEKNKDDEYSKTCKELKLDPELRINGDDISAYLLKREGENSSVVVKQDMRRGIPFASFHDALNDSLNLKFQLEKKLCDANN